MPEGPPKTAREVIEGAWLVETQPHLEAARVLGTLTIRGATYAFVPSGAPLSAESARFVPFLESPSGAVSVFYLSSLDADSLLDAFPRPPSTGGYVQEISVASLQFERSKTSTNHFRIGLDLDRKAARFHPDFHAALFNNPCRVSRMFF
jgi:hypothetical protein